MPLATSASKSHISILLMIDNLFIRVFILKLNKADRQGSYPILTCSSITSIASMSTNTAIDLMLSRIPNSRITYISLIRNVIPVLRWWFFSSLPIQKRMP